LAEFWVGSAVAIDANSLITGFSARAYQLSVTVPDIIASFTFFSDDTFTVDTEFGDTFVGIFAAITDLSIVLLRNNN
jgi:hypothetical protein